MNNEQIERTIEGGFPLARVYIRSFGIPDVIVRKTSIQRDNKYIWHQCYVIINAGIDGYHIYTEGELNMHVSILKKVQETISWLNNEYLVGDEVSSVWNIMFGKGK